MFAEPRRFRFEPQGGSVKTLLVGWVMAEVLALVLVIKILGFGGAVLLSIGSSLLGIVLLRRLGFDAARHLRATIGGRAAPDGALLDGMLAALGALFLILPGFVSDLAGTGARGAFDEAVDCDTGRGLGHVGGWEAAAKTGVRYHRSSAQ